MIQYVFPDSDTALLFLTALIERKAKELITFRFLDEMKIDDIMVNEVLVQVERKDNTDVATYDELYGKIVHKSSLIDMLVK